MSGRTLGESPADYIITPCPTCTHALRNMYPEILHQDKNYGPVAAAMSGRVHDFAEFVCRQAGERGLTLKPLKQKITYHDSCHLKRSLGVAA